MSLRSRGRTIVLTLLFATAVAGAAAFDSNRPAEPGAAALRPSGADSGVAACPIVSDGASRGFLHLANLATVDRARVRVTFVGARGARRVVEANLAAGSMRTIPVGKMAGPTAAMVEYAGGTVVSSHSFWTGAFHAAAASCTYPAAGDIVVAHLRTLRATSVLSVFNPGSADADVSIALIADGRELTPERLTRRVVQAGSRREFSLGDFAFDARDVAAVVHVGAGSVVAEAVVRDATGLSAIEGTIPGTSIVSIAGASGGPATVSIVNATSDPIELGARLISSSAQGAAPGIPPAIDERASLRKAIPSRDKGRAAAYLLGTTEPATASAAASWVVGKRTTDDAAVASVAPAMRLGAVIAPMLGHARADVIIANPGAEQAVVMVRIIRAGKLSQRRLLIDGGRLVAVALGTQAVAVEVSSDRPVAGIVSLVARPSTRERRAGGGLRRAGLAAVSIATMPLDDPPGVGVVLDPRVGIPARNQPAQ